MNIVRSFRPSVLFVLALAALGGGCKREPACFKVRPQMGRDQRTDDDAHKVNVEAFVFANPPDEMDALIDAVSRYCGVIEVPTAASSDIYRIVFRETRQTRRDIALETTKATSVTMHQDDIVLEVHSSRRPEGLFLLYLFRKDGDLAGQKRVRIGDAQMGHELRP